MNFTLLAQATQPVILHATAPDTGWKGTVDTLAHLFMTVLGVAVTAFLIPWIRAVGAAKTAEADASGKQGKVSDEEAKTILSERVKRMAVGLAELFADHKFPVLAAKIAAGKLNDAVAIKAEMYTWGNDLKSALVDQLNAQGIDTFAALGEQYIDAVVERAAAAVSPFPGKDTAIALLKGGAAAIIQHGVSYVRTMNKTAPEGAIPLPPAVAEAIAAGGAAGGTTMASNVSPLIIKQTVAVAPAITPEAMNVPPVIPTVPRVTASGPVRRPQSKV